MIEPPAACVHAIVALIARRYPYGGNRQTSALREAVELGWIAGALVTDASAPWRLVAAEPSNAPPCAAQPLNPAKPQKEGP